MREAAASQPARGPRPEDTGSPSETPEERGERHLARQEGFEAISSWLGWVFGPMAWALHQGVGYAMVPMLCRMGERWPYHLLTGVAFLLCGLGVWASLRALRHAKRFHSVRSEGRIRMMGLVGIMLCSAAFGGIILEYVGSFWIDACVGVE